jgi:cytochrome c556
MRLTALLISAALLAAGCGGGDDQPSKAEFAQDADKICADVSKQVASLGQATTPADLQKTIVSVRRQLSSAIDRLDGLDKPSGNDGKLAQEWIDELRSERGKIDSALADLQTALKNRDADAIKAAGQQLQQLDDKRFTELSRQLGMKSCAS